MKALRTALLMAAGLTAALGSGTPLYAQANDPEAYGDGYQSGAYGRIRAADGGATITRADGDRDQSEHATVNAPLFPGDSIRTDRDQRVEVQLAGGTTIRIDRDAELVFQSLPNPQASYQDNTVLALNAGVVRITSRLADKEEFRIDGRDASVYLMGEGEFRIDASDRGGMRVASLHGVAEVVSGDASVLVRGGTYSVVAPGQAPEPTRAYNAFSSDGFDRWCEARDDAYRSHERYAENGDVDRGSVPDEVQPYYSELSRQGTWSYEPDYGNVWFPAGVGASWRPYDDGYWTYGPGGYFWVSAEPWGWAPYHYGCWQWIPRRGWCWIPGHVFAGAWVSWSWGSAYVGWAPLDFWGRPGWVGGSLYAGYYDPGCWTFVSYANVYHGDVHRYAVPISTVRDDLHHATVVSRPPSVDPRRIANPAEWRLRTLKQVGDDQGAHMRPVDTSRRPEQRMLDIQNHLMRRPTGPPQVVRGPKDRAVATPRDRNTAAPGIRGPVTTPDRPNIDRRQAAPREIVSPGVRGFYERMSRPRESRAPDPRVESPRAEPRPEPSRAESRLAPPPRPQPPPRAEAPRFEAPRAQAPRPAPPRQEPPRQAPPQHQGPPQQNRGHGSQQDRGHHGG